MIAIAEVCLNPWASTGAVLISAASAGIGHEPALKFGHLRKRSCRLSKERNACYGPKPRFMSQSG